MGSIFIEGELVAFIEFDGVGYAPGDGTFFLFNGKRGWSACFGGGEVGGVSVHEALGQLPRI